MSDKPKQPKPEQSQAEMIFSYQLSAAIMQARQIRAAMRDKTPPKVQKLLELFDKKAA